MARASAPLDALDRAASYTRECRARNDAHAAVHPRSTHPLSGPCTVKGLLVVPHLSSQDLTRRPSTWNSYRHDYLIMGLKEDFELAAEAAKTLPESVSNEDKLKLYGLFKQATVGAALVAHVARLSAVWSGGRGDLKRCECACNL
jgi:Acyl CoA binding protein